MVDGAAIAGFLCASVAVLSIVTLITAIILRAAVSLFNKLAGGAASASAVPEPSFGKALGIIVVTMLVNLGVGFVVGLVISFGLAAGGAGENEINIISQLVLFPIGALIMAGVLTAMLPTTFGRAILVMLCHYLIAIAIGLVLFVIAMVVMMVFTLA